MSKVLSAAELKVEEEAQKKRDEAKKYLTTIGQSIDKVDLKKSGITNDNTLELLLAEKRKNISTITSTSTNTNTYAKPSTTTPTNSNDKLLPDWQAVLDSTGKTYYWNLKTNETKWEKPVANEDSCSNTTKIPSFWIEKVHSATFQTYWVHKHTGNKRWEVPAYDDDGTTAEAPSQTTAQSQTAITSSNKRANEEVMNKNKKHRSDPIGPTMKK